MTDIAPRVITGLRTVPVALSCSEYFARFASVTLLSIAECATPGNLYDIVILHTGISRETQTLLQDAVSGASNVEVRFLDIAEHISNIPEPAHIHASVETYCRLIAHKVFTQYDKIIYLDSDVLIRRDLAALMDEPLGDRLIAAAVDADHAGLYSANVDGVRKYTDRVLRLAAPYSYFQAGVLLMNLRAFRRAFGEDELVQMAARFKHMFVDQDILNIACGGNVFFLDMRWNVMVGYYRRKYIVPLAPGTIRQAFESARREPWIVHYAGVKKPWHYPGDDFADLFWSFAVRTPFAQAIQAEYDASKEAYRKKRLFLAAKALAREIKFGYYGMRRKQWK